MSLRTNTTTQKESRATVVLTRSLRPSRYLVALIACLLVSPTFAETYTYDLAGRLTNVGYTDGSSIAYEYDPNGNILRIAKAIGPQPPDGTIDTPDDDVTIFVNDSVNFTGTGADADGALPLTYRWDFDGAAADSVDEDPGDIVFSAAGNYTVEFFVTDATNLTDPTPARRLITVQDAPVSQPPNGQIDTPADNVTIEAGGTVNFTGSGTDPDNELPLAFRWTFGSAAADSNLEDPGDVTFAAAGTYTVTLNVTDASGVADPTPATRTVTVNDPAGGGNGNGGNAKKKGGGAMEVWMILFLLGACVYRLLRNQKIRARFALLGVVMAATTVNAAEWHSMESGTAVDLAAVWGSDSTNVFAVGPAGTILHFDGTTWTTMNSGTGVDLNGIYGYAGDDVYAVGDSATILHYDGNAWTPFSGPNDENGAPEAGHFVDVWTAGPGNNLYILTNRRAYYWDGAAWTPRSFSNQFSATFTPETTLASIGGTAQGILVTGRPFSASGGEFYANFKDTPLFTSAAGMSGAFGLNDTEMFIVGDGTFRFQGGNIRTSRDWIRMGAPMSDPVDVWAASPTAVYAVGTHNINTNGSIAYYDGNAQNEWVQSLDMAGTPMSAVWGFSDADVFAVGDRGTIVRLAEPDPVTTADNYPHSGWLSETVNAHTGELVLETTDLDLGGKIAVQFSRYYASGLKNNVQFSGVLGRNWAHNYEWRLELDAGTASVVTHRGRRIEFVRNGAAWELTTTIGIRYQLVEDATSGRFTLMDPTSEGMYGFDPNNGRLLDIRDRVGDIITVGYIANFSLPVSVSDRSGRGFNFNYDANLNLVAVTTGSGSTTRRVDFEQVDGNLVSVTDTTLGVTRYTYTPDTTAALLTSVTQPGNNTPFTWAYGPDDKVVSQTDADGNAYQTFYQSGTTPSTLLGPDNLTTGILHDDQGRAITLVDEDGFTQRLQYDPVGNITTIFNRSNQSMTMDYDPASNALTRVANPDGRAVRYSYTTTVNNGFTFSDLTTVDFPDGTARAYEKDSVGVLTAQVDEAAQRWEYQYDANYNFTQLKLPTNATLDMTYNADGTMATVSDPAGNTTELLYDGAKRLAVIRHPGPDNLTRRYEYDAADRLTKQVSENGEEISYTYTPNGDIETIDMPAMAPVVYSYDDMNRLTSVQSPEGNLHSMQFDTRGRLKRATNAAGDTEVVTYDNIGRAASLTQGTRPSWTMQYDPEGEMDLMTLPDSKSLDFDSSNNSAGRITAFSDGNSTMRVAYDDKGRVTEITDSGLARVSQEFNNSRGLVTKQTLNDPLISSQFEYDDFGRLIAVRDPNGNAWQRGYDDGGRLTQVSDPLNRVTTFDYDERHLLSRVVYAGGSGSVDIVRHPLGMEAERHYSDGTSFMMQYDALGRLTVAEGMTFDYDADGQLSSSNGLVIGHDKADRLETIELAPGKAVTYRYDDRGRVIGISDWLGDALSFDHDDVGRVTAVNRANNVDTNLGYDLRGRMNLIQEPGISTINLTHDDKGRVVAAQRNVPRPSGLTNSSVVNFNHDVASQVNGFAYDAMGRRMSDDDRDYSWAITGRLDNYTESGATVSFAYDANGMQIERVEGGITQGYIWNYALSLPSISVVRENNQDLRYFVHTPSGDLLYSVEANGERRFYHFDENGNTQFVTSDNGSVLASYAYSPYGELLAAAGNIDNPFTFVGQRGVMQEGDSGLYYMRARFYDAASARFVSRDAAQGTAPSRVNPYQYGRGNPLLFRDPTGYAEEDSDDDGGIWGGFVAAGSYFLDKGGEAVGNLVLGTANVVSHGWNELSREAKMAANMVSARVQAASTTLRQRNTLTIAHAVAEEAAKLRARIPPPKTITQYVATHPALVKVTGLFAGITENTDSYVSTDAGGAASRVGVGGVNAAISAHPLVGMAVGVSTIVDEVTDEAFGVRFGAHEIFNTPARLAAAGIEDTLTGRSMFDARSSVGRVVRNLEMGRNGLLSEGIAYVGGKLGELVIEDTWLGDIVIWAENDQTQRSRESMRELSETWSSFKEFMREDLSF